MSTGYAAPLSAFDEILFRDSTEPDSGVIHFEAFKKVDAGDPYLPGHYPGFVIYPGVFTIETVYQAARDVLSRTHTDPAGIVLSAIRSVRFKNLVLPGDTLRAVCELAPVDGSKRRFRVEGRCEREDGTPTGTVSLEVCVGEPASVPTDGAPPTSVPGPGALGFDVIATLLPHRHPIAQVDQALRMDQGSIVTTKAVTAAEPCYAHVPAGAPESFYDYPLTLLFESMGQSGAVLWFSGQNGGTEDDDALVFGGARACRRLGPVRPGDVMRHVVRTEMVKGDNAVMSGQTWVEDRCVATVDSMIAVVRSRADLVGRRDF